MYNVLYRIKLERQMTKNKTEQDKIRQKIDDLRRDIAIRENKNKNTPPSPTEQETLEEAHPEYPDMPLDGLKSKLTALKEKRPKYQIETSQPDVLDIIKKAYFDEFKREAKVLESSDKPRTLELEFKTESEAKQFFTKMAKTTDFIVKDHEGNVLFQAKDGVLEAKRIQNEIEPSASNTKS